MSVKRKRVLVALSGGVASRVSASLLKTQGFEIYGVHYYINPESARYPLPRFFRPDVQNELQLISKKLDLSVHFEDVTAEFESQVLEPAIHRKFSLLPEVTDYLFCSRFLMPKLYEYAKKIRADYIATGHFSKVVTGLDGTSGIITFDEPLLDQSSSLSRVSSEILNMLLLPVGDLSPVMIYKLDKELESRLKDRSLPTEGVESDSEGYSSYARVPPVSELVETLKSKTTFGPDYWKEEWLSKYVTGDYFLPGPIRSQNDFSTNQYDGLHTVNWGDQINNNPVEVITEYHARTRTLYLGAPEKLQSSFYYLQDVQFLIPHDVMKSISVQVRDPKSLNSKSADAWINGKITLFLGHFSTLELEKPLDRQGVGQPLVFYKENQVIGSGLIYKIGSLQAQSSLVSAPKQG